MIAGDEETYRFLFHVMSHEPSEYRQIRRYPGDWHLLQHMAEALLGRYYGNGLESVASQLGTDNKKSEDASNYRRAHHHLAVMQEAVISVSTEVFLEEDPARRELGKEAIRDGVLEWIKER